MVLNDTTGTSSWLSHCNHPTHRSEFPMQRALAVDFDQRERERERERDLKKKKIEDLNTLPCRVRVVVNL